MTKYGVLLGLLLSAPALAAIATPYVAGDFQGWDPGASAMTETVPGSGIWSATFTGAAAGRHEFKITDGTWNNTYPGANSWAFVGNDGLLTITYDTNTYADGWSPTTERLGENFDPGNFTVTGDFLHLLGGNDWDNASPAGHLTAQGNGLYSLEATLPAGSYNGKFVVTGSWDSISWDNRSINTANWGFTTDGSSNTVIFQLNALAGTARIDVVPEPATLLALGLFGLLLRRR